jgi:glucose/arabinose dehydrogenase
MTLRQGTIAILAVCLAHVGVVRGDLSLTAEFDEQNIVQGLDRPTAFAYAPDGRLFIAEKSGRVRIVTAEGHLLPTSFVTIPVNTANDRGLVGIAIDPDFLENHYVYLAYTTNLVPPSPNNIYSRIHRITRMTANGDVVVPGSEVILVDDVPSDIDSHNGGALRFGPDDKLYVSIGDGASYYGVDPLALRALDLDQPVGKILRINRDGSAPEDNPFYAGPDTVRSKVWQYGLRNPFKMTFRPGTGDLFVNDVGWSSWEEINHAAAGANFGWPCYEGNDPQSDYFDTFSDFCSTVTPTSPLVALAHPASGVAITGGAFYDGPNYPETYRGRYFFADYGLRKVRSIAFLNGGAVSTIENFASAGTGGFLPIDLVQGPDGNLQVLTLATDFSYPSGQVDRIIYVGAGNHSPRASPSATPSSGYAPLAVALSAEGSRDPDGDPLTCRWSFGDGEEADGCEANHDYAAEGTFVATLSVSDGQISQEAKSTVTVGSLPPEASIDAPAPGDTFEEGDIIGFSGTAHDPDEGELRPENLRWTVILHHDTHQHYYQDTTGASGSFIARGHGDTDATFSYEVVLTATDASGLADTKRIIVPQNSAPVAQAGQDFTYVCDLVTHRVVLDATASTDPDDQPLTFTWTQVDGPPVTIEGAATALPSFVPPAVPGGTVLTFRLEVSDGHVPRSATVRVTIPDLTDEDGDGDPFCGDCSPNDPSIAAPADATEFSIDADTRTLLWSADRRATSYELYRGSIGESFAYDHACLAEGIAQPNFTDETLPAQGQALYYLVRATNDCGAAPVGVSNQGLPLADPGCLGAEVSTSSPRW